MDIQKAISEFLAVTIPAVVLYFIGWAYLYFFLDAFGIGVGEIHPDTPTVFIYSVTPIEILFDSLSLNGLIGIAVVAMLAGLVIWAWPTGVRYRQAVGSFLAARSLAVKLALTAACLLVFVLVATPTVRSAAHQASARAWDGHGAQLVALISESSKLSNRLRSVYDKCAVDQALVLVHSDDKAYYLLCKSVDDPTQGNIFEVRHKLGLVSARFVSRGAP